MSHQISQSEENTRMNELLFRRLTVEDAAESHVAALHKAEEIGFDVFIVSAQTPFHRDACKQILHDAPALWKDTFGFPQTSITAKAGACSVHRPCFDTSRIERRLGCVCQTSFASALQELARS